MNFPFSDLAPPRIPEFACRPLVTILIPAFNCSQIISHTLDSIICQNYTDYEILVIDGGSTDRTLEILHAYYPNVRLYSAPVYDVYLILNQGIFLAKGDYINILFPGDSYIYFRTLEQMMALAIQNSLPSLIYCATLLHDGRSEAKFLFRRLCLNLLKRGQQPTSLQACWFKKEVFELLGNFRADFQMRGGFDLLCRFCLYPSFQFISWRRSLVNFDLRGVTSSMVIHHFWETGKTIHHYFGKRALIRWLVRQKDIRRFTLLWVKRLQTALVEKNPSR